ncbi:hypothetical protein HQ560_07070, partial [bacterium]|nr:hypothetical protein [bacterium]
MECGRSVITVLCSGLIACLAALSCDAAEPNLIPNGGFEAAGAKNAALPAAWTPHTDGKVSFGWSAHEPRSGKRCLEMTAEPEEKWGHAFWTSSAIAVKPCMAYRVRFHFRARGRGVTCFSLSKVKDWRLSKHDTEGKWIAHDDVVVVPPDVTSTFFSVNNYHRPGKTMWFDDVSLVELPLSESPLTKRLSRAARNLAALQRNTAPFRLTLAQEEQLGGIRSQLAATRAAY